MKKTIRIFVCLMLVLCFSSVNAELIYPYAELADEATSIERQELYMASMCASFMAYGKFGFIRNIEFLQEATNGMITNTKEAYFSDPSDYRISSLTVSPDAYTRIHAVFSFGSTAAVEIVSEPLPYYLLVSANDYIEETDDLSNYIKAADDEAVYNIPIDAILRAYPNMAADRCILYIYSPYKQGDGLLFSDVIISVF